MMFIGIMLPEVDGYDVCRHVRKYGGPVNGKAYIAALTSVDAPELLSQCQAAGMNEVMRKPTSMQLLHGVFKRAKRHAREEKKKAKMSRGRLKLGGLSADEVAAQERPRPRRINSYAPSDPFAKKEKTDAEKEKEEREKCVPVNLPRYTDMLLASSAARIRQSAHSRASTSSGSNDDGFKRPSWIARLAGSLCGGGSGMNNSEIDVNDALGFTRGGHRLGGGDGRGRVVRATQHRRSHRGVRSASSSTRLHQPFQPFHPRRAPSPRTKRKKPTNSSKTRATIHLPTRTRTRCPCA